MIKKLKESENIMKTGKLAAFLASKNISMGAFVGMISAGVLVIAGSITAAVILLNPPENSTPPAHEHAYSSWTVKEEATCTEKGEESRSCSCGDVETREISAKGHTFDHGIDNICNKCEYTREFSDSVGLEYTENEDGTYTVAGMGTCQDVDLFIPETYNGKAVTAIGDYAFENQTELTAVTIPNSVTNIGLDAFYECNNIVAMSIPFTGSKADGTGTVSFDYLFGSGVPECLKAVIVTGGTSIKFSFCSNLTSVTIPDSVTSIGSYAFEWCTSLTSVSIPDSVTRIGTEAFSQCHSLRSITLPDNVTFIGSEAFQGTLLIYNGYNEYDNALYLGTKDNPYAYLIKSINQEISSCKIHEDTELIATGAFSGCQRLRDAMVIPNGVLYINSSAFSNCERLTSVTIPDSVTSIGSATFSDCERLTSINFSGTKAQWDAISNSAYWDNGTGNYIVYCADGTIAKE